MDREWLKYNAGISCEVRRATQNVSEGRHWLAGHTLRNYSLREPSVSRDTSLVCKQNSFLFISRIKGQSQNMSSLKCYLSTICLSLTVPPLSHPAPHPLKKTKRCHIQNKQILIFHIIPSQVTRRSVLQGTLILRGHIQSVPSIY